jgi:hypothetical protein
MSEKDFSYHKRPSLQNIRVGEMLGQRHTGAGASNKLGGELMKFRNRSSTL